MSLIVAALLAPGSRAQDMAHPGCEGKSAKECVGLGIEAMGGRERLEALKSVKLEGMGYTQLEEQSYRQEPFISSYAKSETTLDFAGGRALLVGHLMWPEADPKQWAADATAVIGPEGGVGKGGKEDSPISRSQIEAARQMLALGPGRILLTADAANDLHYVEAEMLRTTPHTVIAFTWEKIPARVLLNEFNHLPDAVETTQEFGDFWYFWGDVKQRIYFDNWKIFDGIEWPTNLVEERNGKVWRSSQAFEVTINAAIDEKDFAMDVNVAKRSAAGGGLGALKFSGKDSQQLAPGVDLFLGAWNSTIVKQPDGIVILEAPISEGYTRGVIEEAKKLYPGVRVKAVLSTSDSWPHTGGVRYAVSQNLPVYILDLNRALLDREVAAPHTVDPDELAKAGAGVKPRWTIVSGKTVVGSGENRMELYPLRGASTERQYMVYFPSQHILYASDTLGINDDKSLYDPELMYEVARAVKREGLQVQTVFAMHQGPVPWSDVMALVAKARAN
jgi:hypothetical protein